MSHKNKVNSKINILAILGLCFSLIPIVGLVLSILGLNKSKHINNKGLIISIIGIVISALILIAFIASLTFTNDNDQPAGKEINTSQTVGPVKLSESTNTIIDKLDADQSTDLPNNLQPQTSTDNQTEIGGIGNTSNNQTTNTPEVTVNESDNNPAEIKAEQLSDAAEITQTIAPDPQSEEKTTSSLAKITIRSDCYDPTYNRSSYSHWSQADRYAGEHKNVREKVLFDEQKYDGSWYSHFDNQIIYSTSQLDIDHFVPLAEAHRSGACKWSKNRKKDFANWIDDDYTLIAVSSKSNRSKSDQDPAKWMPTNVSYHCTYLTTWIQIKLDWSLSMNQSEYDAIKTKLQSC